MISTSAKTGFIRLIDLRIYQINAYIPNKYSSYRKITFSNAIGVRKNIFVTMTNLNIYIDEVIYFFE